MAEKQPEWVPFVALPLGAMGLAFGLGSVALGQVTLTHPMHLLTIALMCWAGAFFVSVGLAKWVPAAARVVHGLSWAMEAVGNFIGAVIGIVFLVGASLGVLYLVVRFVKWAWVN